MSLERKYAVAVRDGDDLWLVRRLRRASNGDIYVLMPWTSQTSDEKVPRDFRAMNPHASYHRDGRVHWKVGNKPSLRFQRQKPDGNLKGSEPIFGLPISMDDVRALGMPCRSEDFPGGVIEFPASEITPLRGDTRSAIAFHLVEPGVLPAFSPAHSIIQRFVFDDDIPHISVTLFDQLAWLDEAKSG